MFPIYFWNQTHRDEQVVIRDAIIYRTSCVRTSKTGTRPWRPCGTECFGRVLSGGYTCEVFICVSHDEDTFKTLQLTATYRNSLIQDTQHTILTHMSHSSVSRAKWRTFLKCSHKVRFARRSDARLPYPTLTGWHHVHHKTGRPSAATSHELRPGKPSFCIFGPPTETTSPRGRTDNSIHRAWQALGIIILIPAA